MVITINHVYTTRAIKFVVSIVLYRCCYSQNRTVVHVGCQSLCKLFDLQKSRPHAFFGANTMLRHVQRQLSSGVSLIQ